MPKNQQDESDERFRKDIEYYEANEEEFLRNHRDHWIAVFDQRVVGTSPDLDDLLDTLQRKRLPIGHIYIQYARPDEEILILAGA